MSARERIIFALGAKPAISPQVEISQRVRLLGDTMIANRAKVIIVSARDTTEALIVGALAKKARHRLATDRHPVKIIALACTPFVPTGAALEQIEEHVEPDQIIQIDTDANATALTLHMSDHLEMILDGREEKVARDVIERFISASRHIVSNTMHGMVIGTQCAHSSIRRSLEEYRGGSAPSDFNPLAGLTLRQMVEIAAELGLPDSFRNDEPWPLQSSAKGINSTDIDDFLEGKNLREDDSARIIKHYSVYRKRRSLEYDL